MQSSPNTRSLRRSENGEAQVLAPKVYPLEQVTSAIEELGERDELRGRLDYALGELKRRDEVQQALRRWWFRG